jgi:hypothetical protein
MPANATGAGSIGQNHRKNLRLNAERAFLKASCKLSACAYRSESPYRIRPETP